MQRLLYRATLNSNQVRRRVLTVLLRWIEFAVWPLEFLLGRLQRLCEFGGQLLLILFQPFGLLDMAFSAIREFTWAKIRGWASSIWCCVLNLFRPIEHFFYRVAEWCGESRGWIARRLSPGIVAYDGIRLRLAYRMRESQALSYLIYPLDRLASDVGAIVKRLLILRCVSYFFYGVELALGACIELICLILRIAATRMARLVYAVRFGLGGSRQRSRRD